MHETVVVVPRPSSKSAVPVPAAPTLTWKLCGTWIVPVANVALPGVLTTGDCVSCAVTSTEGLEPTCAVAGEVVRRLSKR